MFNRRYARRIEVWTVTEVSDGYGGYTHSKTKVKDIWAEIDTAKAGYQRKTGYKFTQYGLNDFKNPVIFRIRGVQNDIDWSEDTSIIYKGREYIVKGYVDVGLQGYFIDILTEGI